MVHFFARMVVESVEEAFVEVPAIRMPHTAGNDTALLLTVQIPFTVAMAM